MLEKYIGKTIKATYQTYAPDKQGGYWDLSFIRFTDDSELSISQYEDVEGGYRECELEDSIGTDKIEICIRSDKADSFTASGVVAEGDYKYVLNKVKAEKERIENERNRIIEESLERAKEERRKKYEELKKEFEGA